MQWQRHRWGASLYLVFTTLYGYRILRLRLHRSLENTILGALKVWLFQLYSMEKGMVERMSIAVGGS